MQVSIHGTFGPFSNPTGRAVSSVVVTYTAVNAANSALRLMFKVQTLSKFD